MEPKIKKNRKGLFSPFLSFVKSLYIILRIFMKLVLKNFDLRLRMEFLSLNGYFNNLNTEFNILKIQDITVFPP